MMEQHNPTQLHEVDVNRIASYRLGLADEESHLMEVRKYAVPPAYREVAELALARVRNELPWADADSNASKGDEVGARNIAGHLHPRWYERKWGPIPWESIVHSPDEVASTLYLNRGPVTEAKGPMDPDRRCPFIGFGFPGAVWLSVTMSPLEIVFSVARQARLLQLIALKMVTDHGEAEYWAPVATEFALRVVKQWEGHVHADEA